MTAKVDIWNLALLRLSQTVFVQSPDEQSTNAGYCRLLYPNARDAALRDFDWNFASKSDSSAIVDTDIDGWAFAYQYPSDCLAVREIIDETKTHRKIPFKVGIIGTQKVIFTDEEEAKFRYTTRIEDSTLFDASYVQSLSWKLAAELAQPVTKKDAILEKMVKGYQASLIEAYTADANEEESQEEPDAPWHEGRG